MWPINMKFTCKTKFKKTADLFLQYITYIDEIQKHPTFTWIFPFLVHSVLRSRKQLSNSLSHELACNKSAFKVLLDHLASSDFKKPSTVSCDRSASNCSIFHPRTWLNIPMRWSVVHEYHYKHILCWTAPEYATIPFLALYDWTGRHTKAHTKFAVFRSTKAAVQENEDWEPRTKCQLVSTEDGTTVVPIFDWTSFFAPRMKKLSGIKKLRHFCFDSAKPGEVVVKERSDLAETTHDLLKQPDPQTLPDIVPQTSVVPLRQDSSVLPFRITRHNLPTDPRPTSTPVTTPATCKKTNVCGRTVCPERDWTYLFIHTIYTHFYITHVHTHCCIYKNSPEDDCPLISSRACSFTHSKQVWICCAPHCPTSSGIQFYKYNRLLSISII